MGRERGNPTWSGPRLSSGIKPREPTEGEGDGDPAGGDAPYYCAECGTPDQPHNRLLMGRWSLGTFSILDPRCEKCINRRAPFDPRTADPLHIEAA